MGIKTIILIAIIVLIIGGFLIVSSNKFDFSTNQGKLGFAKAYFGWTGQIVKNFYSITAYAVKLDWIPSS
jgi:hypothetical protein